eukprot:scpid41140/ scgid35747/ Sushi, von Willebrand factor type A, EGF and pentraxin domain-containing protein 1; CCP module-containing protein 22; Polydom; Selectin-like osteoblast-derived protein; Serologically defined breast cancer antigen NY-BR-38
MRLLAIAATALIGLCSLHVAVGQDIPGPCAIGVKCDNGGTCNPSPNPLAPSYFNCTCPTLYNGTHCENPLCADPGTPVNGTRTPAMTGSLTRFTNGSLLHYACLAGFRLDNAADLICSNTAWYHAVNGMASTPATGGYPKCMPVFCDYPPAVSTGGSLSPSGPARLPYNAVVTVQCNTGYAQAGSTTRRCAADGNLTGTVQACQLIQCSVPATPSHGSLTPQASKIPYNSTVTAVCDSGYQLSSGNALRRCMANGQLSGSAASCTDYCKSNTCPASASSGNQSWTDCCKFAGDSIQCCQPGVQNVLDDRYRNITNPTCRTDLAKPQLFRPCVGDLITCLSRQANYVQPRCPDIHGCSKWRNAQTQCQALFGISALFCTSTAFEKDHAFNTTFCLPPSCSNNLKDLAVSDYLMNCDVATKIGGQSKCPIFRVEIVCPDGNGTYDTGGNNPPTPNDSGGVKPGIIALVIILVMLGILALVAVIVIFYRKGKRNMDSTDFARLSNADDDDDDDDTGNPTINADV